MLEGDMTPENLQEQLTKYLTDAHSIEEQALAQVKVAPRLAGDEEIAAAFSQHLRETEDHEHLVRDRLQARSASPAKVKDLVGALTGRGFVAFARSQPDTTGKLVAHAYSYEHMELAAYELLGMMADRAGDDRTSAVAGRIAEQERTMGGRLEGLFDGAVEASLREVRNGDMHEQVERYLADAHAIEAQSLKLLEKASSLAGGADLAAAYEEHREETEEHERVVAERLRTLGASPSRLKDAVLRLGALNWAAFFAAQPDTPAKLAAFTYAYEHLEIASYELLRRVADRAGDGETALLAFRLTGDERAAAERIRSLFERALDASLHARDVTA
jgi:ferritin-like metal-binding protein YciE